MTDVDDKNRAPYTEPWTDDQLREIRDRASAAGDVEKADLAHAFLWGREFCDRARGATVALAREVRRVFGPILDLGGEREAAVCAILDEVLDGKMPEPTLDEVDGPTIKVGHSHWAIRCIVESLRESVEPAPNFIELVVGIPGNGPYLVTVTKPRGKKPTEVIAEAKAKIARVEAALGEVPDRAVGKFRKHMGEVGPDGFGGDRDDEVALGGQYDGEPVWDREYRQVVAECAEEIRALLK